MPNEFKVKNGLLVDTGGAQVTGSLFVTGGLALNTSGTIFTTNSSTVFSIDGAAGRLFQVDDSLSGSLTSVNTVAGLPVFEVFSDNTVRIGQYGRRALYVSQSAVGIGKEASLNGVLDISGSTSITGSLSITGSFTVFTENGSELQAIAAGIKIGNAITDTHSITGSLNVSGSITGSLFGTSSWAVTASFINTAQTASYVITALTASFITGSNVYGPYGSNSVTSASYAVTATNAPLYLPLAGGTITGNLSVEGTASIAYLSASTLFITSSQLNIGTNIITVNTLPNTLRFGGLAVIDSGSSPQQSGSILYDSVQDEWIFVHRGAAASAITSSHFLVGPESYNNVGNETYITTNYIVKSTGNEHMTSASIVDDSTTIRLLTNSQITGSLTVTAGITGSLQGTSSWAVNATTASNIQGGVDRRLALWTGSTTVGPSAVYQSGSWMTANIGINSSDFTIGAAEALLVSGSTINIIVGESTQNNYTQLNIHNHSAGTNASADVVATNDTGNETGNFVDMGINSSGFTGTIGIANEAYLYNTGSNFLIGNTTRGVNANLKLFAGNDASTFPVIVTGSNALITGSLLGTASFAATASFAIKPDFHLIFAVSDETTALTTGTSKLTFRAPYAMTLTQIPRASLATASSSGPVTVDINDNGTSILGANKLTIDVNEKTSTTAGTPTTLADTAIPDDAEITVDIDAAGTGAAGLKIILYYVKT